MFPNPGTVIYKSRENFYVLMVLGSKNANSFHEVLFQSDKRLVEDDSARDKGLFPR